MDPFDIFFKKFAYKFPKGYPDMNDEQDILLLENLLGKLGIDINEAEFKNLNFFDLGKRGGYRFADLANKIKNKLPFELANGESTVLQFIKPQYSTVFLSREKDDIKKLAMGKNINLFPFFKDNTGKTYSISDLLKDSYFGGQGKGSGTKVEDANLQLLNNQILNLVEENGGPINVKVGNKIYNNIIKAETQPGQPKSDFNLIDEENNPVIFISHKKAGGKYADATDFIRWSGYTMYAEDPEVIAFNTALEDFLQKNNLSGVPNKTRFIAPIKNEELIHKLIYGPDYGGEYSKDNVNIILQGEIFLKPKDPNTYELSAEHVLTPPNIPNKDSDYYPYLTSSYRADRGMFEIPNNEAIAMTKSVANKASNVYELDKQGQFIKIK